MAGEALGAERQPVESDELELLRKQRKSGEHPLGDMPLVVLIRGLSDDDGPDSKSLYQEHRTDMELVARLSRNGKLVVAPKSSHHIQIDEPLLVVTAIRGLLASIRP